MVKGRIRFSTWTSFTSDIQQEEKSNMFSFWMNNSAPTYFCVLLYPLMHKELRKVWKNGSGILKAFSGWWTVVGRALPLIYWASWLRSVACDMTSPPRTADGQMWQSREYVKNTYELRKPCCLSGSCDRHTGQASSNLFTPISTIPLLNGWKKTNQVDLRGPPWNFSLALSRPPC